MTITETKILLLLLLNILLARSFDWFVLLPVFGVFVFGVLLRRTINAE